MFIVVLLAILALIHLYLWKRLVKDTTAPGRTRWTLTAVLLGMFVLLLATMLLPRMVGVTESRWLAWPGYLWFAVAGYLFLFLLILEPVWLALRRWVKGAAAEPTAGEPDGGMDRRRFLARSGAAIAGVGSVGLVGFGVARALRPPDVLDVPVRLRTLNPALDGFRIAMITDLHLGPLVGRSHTERIVRMINEAEPDLVVIVGDLIDGEVHELASAAEPLRDLRSAHGTFFALGNHEYYVNDTDAWIEELDRLGVQTLRNANTVIRRGSAAFTLAGVTDIAGEMHSDPPDFGRALAGADPSRPTVLLAHQPDLITEAAEHGVDLQLSGHTHGGQVWPFHVAVRAVQPVLAGLHTVGDTQLYVSRGAGFWGPPARVGAPPDISVLTLRSGA
ncbi:metallophosphoesterase [Mycolicibacterium thermoresistibile]